MLAIRWDPSATTPHASVLGNLLNGRKVLLRSELAHIAIDPLVVLF